MKRYDSLPYNSISILDVYLLAANHILIIFVPQAAFVFQPFSLHSDL